MKSKHLAFFLLLLSVSCKVTETKIVGFYKSDHADLQMLQINPDHTFLYEDIDFAKEFVNHADIDSFHFCARGNWTFIKGCLMLNSFNGSFTDTGRITKIVKQATKIKNSNFTFKNNFGNTIVFNAIEDEKETFAAIFDKSYSDYDIDLSKHKKLIFYLGG